MSSVKPDLATGAARVRPLSHRLLAPRPALLRARANLERADLVRGGLVALIIALVFALFHLLGATEIPLDSRLATPSAFVWIWRRWLGDLENTWLVIGFWIPALALLMVWSRRRELRAAAGPASGLGLAFVILALTLHWAGARAQQTRLSLAAFALLAWAIPFYMAGRGVARRLAFPSAFLLLALPLNFLDGATRPLRFLAVQLSAGILSALGLNVGATASQVYSRMEHGFRLNLADPASGLPFLTTLLALLLTVGFLRRWGGRTLLAWLAVLPAVCVAANVMRTVVFALAGEAFGSSAAGGGFARWSPLVMLLSAAALLAGLAEARRRYRAAKWKPRPEA